MEEKDINWLAGYMDGRGCFYVAKHGKYKQFSIKFSDDENTLKKIKEILGFGSLCINKQLWISNRKDVSNMITFLRGRLKLRSEEFDVFVKEFNEY